jgi:acyl-CoA dehydrogenase
MQIGRRHLALNSPFQNGPILGKDVFVPLTQLIGGEKYAGQGWRMLVECLSVGRAISLPSASTGAVRIAAVGTGAYARIRKQFGLSIGRFEGVEEALARIGGHAYQISALSQATAAAVDRGEKPSVPSAIAKYWATELGRQVITDAMDVQAGKGVILGPRNFIGRMWQGAPIGITVEGANILTRSMIIFGQGATRCHPYVLKEMLAAANPDPEKRVDQFDKALFGHMGFTISNAVRSFWFGLTGSYLGSAPGDAYTRRFYRKLTRYSAALALVADMAMLTLGGKLKFKERLSARLGDVLSHLYIASAMLKRFEDQGRPTLDRPLLAWGVYDSVFRMQNALVGALRNLPNRPLAWVLGWLVFPLGQRERAPGDRTGHKVAQLLMSNNEARDRLAEFTWTTPEAHNVPGRMLAALADVIAAEPVERKLEKARKAGTLHQREHAEQVDEALATGVITVDEKALLLRVREATLEAISVDDFDSAELEAAIKTKRPAQPSHLRNAA